MPNQVPAVTNTDRVQPSSTMEKAPFYINLQIAVSATVNFLLLHRYKSLILQVGDQDVQVSVSKNTKPTQQPQTENQFANFPALGIYVLTSADGNPFTALYAQVAAGSSTLNVTETDETLQAPQQIGNPAQNSLAPNVLDTLTTQATTKTGNSLDLHGTKRVSAVFNITNVGTSPTLVITPQGSNDGTNFSAITAPNTNTAVATASITANGVYELQFDCYFKYMRFNYTIGGTTPSYTLTTTVVSTN